MAKQKERAAWACPNGECQHLVRAAGDWSDDANPQCGRCGTQMVPCAAIDMSVWVAIVKRIAATDAELERLRGEPEEGDTVIRRLMDAAFSSWPNELVSWKREAVFKFAQDVWRAAQAGDGATLTTVRALIADDAYAMTFQTMGQYRTALLAVASPVASPSPRLEGR